LDFFWLLYIHNIYLCVYIVLCPFVLSREAVLHVVTRLVKHQNMIDFGCRWTPSSSVMPLSPLGDLRHIVPRLRRHTGVSSSVPCPSSPFSSSSSYPFTFSACLSHLDTHTHAHLSTGPFLPAFRRFDNLKGGNLFPPRSTCCLTNEPTERKEEEEEEERRDGGREETNRLS